MKEKENERDYRQVHGACVKNLRSLRRGLALKPQVPGLH